MQRRSSADPSAKPQPGGGFKASRVSKALSARMLRHQAMMWFLRACLFQDSTQTARPNPSPSREMLRTHSIRCAATNCRSVAMMHVSKVGASVPVDLEVPEVLVVGGAVVP